MNTPETFVLPAYWASCLINGDASGLEVEELGTLNAFLAREDMKGLSCVSCGEESYFAKSNDAGTMAGEVLEYTFLRAPSTSTDAPAGVVQPARTMPNAEAFTLKDGKGWEFVSTQSNFNKGKFTGTTNHRVRVKKHADGWKVSTSRKHDPETVVKDLPALEYLLGMRSADAHDFIAACFKLAAYTVSELPSPESVAARYPGAECAPALPRFTFATDSGSGSIPAASLQDAYDDLRAEITNSMIEDGATLWVEDAEGNRITMAHI